jgi:acyl carrier protein
LYIGGAGVARGYLNHPGLTAERFIPDSFGSKPGVRLYHTGDLVRYRMDGQLEFLGRIDDQLKIQGYRVETEEIAVTLRQHSSLRDAFVTAIQDTNGDKRLVAYLIIARGQEPSVTELRAFLKEKLPEYMIPSAFVRLTDLPLTAAGKVDRRALPEPDVVRPRLTTSYVAPQGETEELIAALWREVLQVETVGVHDNFFDLGGNSFGVYELYSKLCELLDCQLSILDLFKYPTVKALTGHIQTLGEKQPVRQSLEETEKRTWKHQQANSRREQMAKERAAKANVQQ